MGGGGAGLLLPFSFFLGAPEDLLLWNPAHISRKAVKEYLIKVNGILQGREGLPCGAEDRDNEHALNTLHSCAYNTGKALAQFSQELSRGCG